MVSYTNQHFETCTDGVPGNTTYPVRQTSGLVDLTGDGILDHVFWSQPREDGYPDNPYTGAFGWMMRPGLGVGYTAATRFGDPIEIDSTFDMFELSLTEETCDGVTARTVAGLADLDGDGRP